MLTVRKMKETLVRGKYKCLCCKVRNSQAELYLVFTGIMASGGGSGTLKSMTLCYDCLRLLNSKIEEVLYK